MADRVDHTEIAYLRLVPTLSRENPHEVDIEIAKAHALLAIAEQISETETTLAALMPKLDKLVEQMKRLADAVELQYGRVSTCGHGYTGICMFCVRDMDLLRPRT